MFRTLRGQFVSPSPQHLHSFPSRYSESDRDESGELGSSAGTNPGHCGLSRMFKIRETAMKIAKIMLAGTAALTIVSSAALAQQALTGTVTKVDRINRSVAIKQTQGGTVGANTGGAAEEFKAQEGLSLDTLHAGDKVTFSASETGGVKTITKFQTQ
jgi:Cu/Ag efflux protein CusF